MNALGLSALHVAAGGCNHHCLGPLLDGVTALGGGAAQALAHTRGRTPPSALNVTAAGTQWTPLHAACHAGNLVSVASLLRAGASVACLDSAGRTCFDLLCATVDSALETNGGGSAGTGWSVLYSWGSTVNFALGRNTGASSKAGPVDETPRCVPFPRDEDGDTPGTWVSVSAAKFHSAAVDDSGRLFTWGWGASRTGHGQPASSSSSPAVDGSLAGGVVLFPRRVLGFPRQHGMAVVSVACGKHHTLCCTSDGAVYAWGSSKDGRLGLGHGCADTVYSPQRLQAPSISSPASSAQRVARVFAGAKHSAAVSADGMRLFTWGSNMHAQLGYGVSETTGGSDKAAHAGCCGLTPRPVDALPGLAKAKGNAGWTIADVALGKRHSLVLTSDGDCLSFGFGRVTARRVTPAPGTHPFAGATSAEGFAYTSTSAPRLKLTAIAAGTVASLGVVASTGHVIAWPSEEPCLRAAHVAIGTHTCVAVAASKTRCAAVTDAGDVFTWDVGVHAAPGATPSQAAGRPPRRKSVGGALTASGSLPKSGSLSALATSPASSGGGLQALQQLSGGGGDSPCRTALVHAPVKVSALAQCRLLAVGEKHTLAVVGGMCAPQSPCARKEAAAAVSAALREDGDDVSLDGCEFGDDDEGEKPSGGEQPSVEPLSLKALCEDAAAAAFGADPKDALGLADAADALYAPRLRTHACLTALVNLRCVLHMHAGVAALAGVQDGVLLEMQRLIANPSAAGATTAAMPGAASAASAACTTSSLLVRLDCVEAAESARLCDAAREAHLRSCARQAGNDGEDEEGLASGSEDEDTSAAADAAAGSQLHCIAALRKKLLALHALEEKLRRGTGAPLDGGQLAKLGRKGILVEQLCLLERGEQPVFSRHEGAAAAAAASQGDGSSDDGGSDSGNSARRRSRRRRGAVAARDVGAPASEAVVPDASPQLAAMPVPGCPAEVVTPSPAARKPALLVPSPLLPSSPQYSSSAGGASGSGGNRRRMLSLSAFLSGSADVAQPGSSPPAAALTSPPPAAPRGWGDATSHGAGTSPPVTTLSSIIEREQQQAYAARAAKAGWGYSLAAASAAAPAAAASVQSTGVKDGRVCVPLAALMATSSPPGKAPSSPPVWGGATPPATAYGSPLAPQPRAMEQGGKKSSGRASAAAPPGSWYIPERPGTQHPAGSSLHDIMAAEAAQKAFQADAELARQLQSQEDDAAAAAAHSGQGKRRGKRSGGRPVQT